MKHRERVWMALNHEKPDRCPLQVSFTPEFAARLRSEMGLEDRPATSRGKSAPGWKPWGTTGA